MGRGVREEEEASECSSGCQSGWTMYLDQSYENLTPPAHKKSGGSKLEVEVREEEEDEGEEEDLSMVSDASSGPPHFHEAYSYCCYSAATAASALADNAGKRRRVEAEQQPQPKEPSFLDDTASSPLFSFPKASYDGTTKKDPPEDHVLEFSSCFSATHFKRNPALEKHLGYMQSSSPVKRSPARPQYSCREEEEKMW